MSAPDGYETTFADEIEFPATQVLPLTETERRLVESGSRRLTDDGNAYRLVDEHGDDLRYLPGSGWHSWDGTRWLRDADGDVVRRSRDIVRSLHADADRAAADGADPQHVKVLRQHAKASASRRGIEAMIAIARSDERVLVHVSELDRNPLLLNAPNGTIDLSSGHLREHDRCDLITRRTAVAYDPDAAAPTWDGFLERVQPDEAVRNYLQRVAGAAAVGHNADERLHLFWGGGANGKTKCVETISNALGDYAVTAAAELFLADRARSAGQPELVRLRGARLLTASEFEEGSQLNVALVKALTGGDTIAARYLYSNEIVEFTPVFSPWLRTNNRPGIPEQSDAIWRRVRLLPFIVTIPEDERDIGLQGKLNAELGGVLAWIVRGAVDYLANGLGAPEGVMEATAAYREEEDVLGAFIDDRCIVGKNLTALAGPLYTAWEWWAKGHGEKPGTANSFGRRLSDAGYAQAKEAGQRVRRGLALREHEEMSDA